ITGCRISGNAGGGILITKWARKVVLAGNTILCAPNAYPGVKNGPLYGIGLGNNAGEQILISGNLISGAAKGILLQGSGHVVSGNRIGQAREGIHVYGDSHTVSGNTVTDC